MSIRKEIHSTLKTIRGFVVEIKSMKVMEYDGTWTDDGFDVYLGLKKITNFVGYPTDLDLTRVIIKHIKPT